MSGRIKAVYEKGVFRPVQSVSLPEGTAVEVDVPVKEVPFDPEEFARTMNEIASMNPPTDEVEAVAREHDRYLYGDKGPL